MKSYIIYYITAFIFINCLASYISLHLVSYLYSIANNSFIMLVNILLFQHYFWQIYNLLFSKLCQHNRLRPKPNTNKLTTSILAAVIYVAKQLLLQKALLLPWASQIFLQSYNSHHTDTTTSAKLILELDESEVIYSSRWLLNQLISSS